MTEAPEAFVLHPTVLSVALQPNDYHHAIASRLLGEVAMGRRTAYIAGEPLLLELGAIDALISSSALEGLSVEDLTNVLHDIRQLLSKMRLNGRLIVEGQDPYLLAATTIAAGSGLDFYTALMTAIAATRGLPLVYYAEALHGRLQQFVGAHPGLRIVNLSELR